MAGSRLEKIGTIFSRTSGLLQTGAMKVEDKPIWYDVYAIHAPDREPRFDREPPNTEIRQIFYEEDIVRAKFHQARKYIGNYNIVDTSRKTQTQEFIEMYNNLRAQGALDDEKIFEIALEQLADKRQPQEHREEPIRLVDDFQQAVQQQPAAPAKPTAPSVSVTDFYKE